MDTPGYDPVGATGQVAGGCNVMCFTTGRGSAFGCKPTPSIKLATNTEMYRRMSDDMDINCGDVIDGTSIERKGQEIFEKVLQVASGTHTKSEDLGYGDLQFVPWQIGSVMEGWPPSHACELAPHSWQWPKIPTRRKRIRRAQRAPRPRVRMSQRPRRNWPICSIPPSRRGPQVLARARACGRRPTIHGTAAAIFPTHTRHASRRRRNSERRRRPISKGRR